MILSIFVQSLHFLFFFLIIFYLRYGGVIIFEFWISCNQVEPLISATCLCCLRKRATSCIDTLLFPTLIFGSIILPLRKHSKLLNNLFLVVSLRYWLSWISHLSNEMVVETYKLNPINHYFFMLRRLT